MTKVPLPFKTKPYRARFSDLRSATNEWRVQWKDISEYLMPNKGRYLTDDADSKVNKGKAKRTKIINSTPKDGVRTLAAGLQGGLTSPSRPWFRLGLSDQELSELHEVKMWLHATREIVLAVFARSNFYDAVHGCYIELPTFGTAAMLIEEDFETVVRFRNFTVGEYMLALNPFGRPDTLYRQIPMTARQLEQDFGRDNLSRDAINALDNFQWNKRFDVIHCIQPNTDYTPNFADKRGKAFESIWFQKDPVDSDTFLRRSGYFERPFVSPRWDFAGMDVYGEGPGHDSIGDIKMLQEMETQKLRKLAKNVTPPMNAPASLRGKGGSVASGALNYVDTPKGQSGFSPTYIVDSDIRSISEEIRAVELRIKGNFFYDLFLSLISSTKRFTATEIVQQNEDKMLILGPVLERLQTELLEPTIARTIAILFRLGLLPEVPEVMRGAPLKVDYISTLAQAQKLTGTAGIEQTLIFAGSLAQFDPQVADKIDGDETLNQYSDLVGVPPGILRTDEDVAEIRRVRRQQQQAAALNEAAATAAQTTKTLSEATPADENLLGAFTEGLG